MSKQMVEIIGGLLKTRDISGTCPDRVPTFYGGQTGHVSLDMSRLS
jgi:hypothetical protein